MAIKASIEVEAGTLTLEAEVEVEEIQALIKALILQMPQLSILLSTNNNNSVLLHHNHLKLHFKARMKGLHARSAEKWDIMPLTAIIG
jgi:hypothetical protein